MKQQYGMSLYRRDQYLREQERQTKYAPRIHCKGPHIRSFENITRVAIFPDHTHTDGSLKEEGVSRVDLTHRGFSVFRNKYTSRSTVDNFVSEQIERNPARRLEYVLKFLAGDIRAVKDQDNYQAFVIVDDSPTPKLRGHALILCADKQPKSKVKELRRKLVKLINSPFSLDEVFPK